jgi:hypothetical protein
MATHSFSSPPYINPAIVKDLQTWLSDTEEQVVAINLETNKSNRYSVTTYIRSTDSHPVIVMKEPISSTTRKSYFSYQLIGKTPDGIHVLLLKSSGGGSGIFTSLMLVELVEEQGLALTGNTMVFSRPRKLIKRLGSIELGDRYDGTIRLENRTLHIEADRNEFSGVISKSLAINIEECPNGQ